MQHSLLPSADLNPTAYTPIKSTKNSIDSVRDFGQSDMQKKSGGLKKSELWTSKSLVFLHLDDHRPCTTGFCMHGVCQASKANLILRFWGLYDKVSDNALELLVRNNLVLLIVSLSLMLWIPSAIAVRKWKRRPQTESRRNTESQTERMRCAVSVPTISS